MTVENINGEIIIRIPSSIDIEEVQRVIDFVAYREANVHTADRLKTAVKKPSDFFGTLSIAEGEKFQKYLTDTRLEWERNI